jgi:hypothetical protein
LNPFYRSYCTVSVPDYRNGSSGAAGSAVVARAESGADGDMRLTGCTTSGAPNAASAARGVARCRSKRAFTIHLRHPRRDYTRSARVTVDGKRVRVRKGHPHFSARVDLRGKRATQITVRIVSRTRSGKVVRETRRYRTCTSAKRS